jgi:hypothetical protein
VGEAIKDKACQVPVNQTGSLFLNLRLADEKNRIPVFPDKL